jgi:hypothetical protein
MAVHNMMPVIITLILKLLSNYALIVMYISYFVNLAANLDNLGRAR